MKHQGKGFSDSSKQQKNIKKSAIFFVFCIVNSNLFRIFAVSN